MSLPHEIPYSRDTPVNALLKAAYPLLNAISGIRFSPAPDDPGLLREQMINEIRRFEKRCQQTGLSHEMMTRSRYCLCTALDEAVSLTPWGGDSLWSGNGLLNTFHNETRGGETFFCLLDELLLQPEKHLDELELIYYCLSLGFGGRYRVIEHGQARLQSLVHHLAEQLRRARGSYPAELSPPRPPMTIAPTSGRPWHLLWVCSLFGCMLLFGLYIILVNQLDGRALPVQRAIYSLPLPKSAPAVDLGFWSLKQALKDEIARGDIAWDRQPGKLVITLKGGDLFAPASASLNPRYKTIIERIARHLAFPHGTITVNGHSDSQNISRSKYASNQDLSLARAEGVADLLRSHLQGPSWIRATAPANPDPLVPDDTPANRAINRRIDIIYQPQAPDDVAP
ncbi:type IVB secretion system protein IcmH/DotU [Biostraticola tofi]|uniref:Type VI secretion system protein ImpK n=1 Tax=Biostraticola tofi TaxID=466109 RepID=A0A4R3Z1E9_9GAMM|nr:type IVB secretion system protein IcmH/DotU [Biostraticola tofi]TCV98821.1 type VI secretion system protein ImpK [Biostraticola tofi]